MLTNKSQARLVRDRRLELVTKSALGLNQEKEIAMHLLFDESPEPVLSSDTKAITAIANNQSEHTYIRALACALLTRLYSFQEKVVRANAWSETLASLLETLTPEQRKEKVWARVKYTPDGPVYGQVSVQQYINNVGSMIGHIMVPPPGEKEIMEARTPLDVNPHIMMSDDLKGALLDLCSHGAIPETFCRSLDCAATSTLSDAKYLNVPYAKLRKCEGCMAVYYCSRECQRQDWKEGHKRSCRPIQELREGDLVRIHGLSNNSELNRRYRELGKYIDAKGRWEVTWIGGTNGVLIKPENLKRVVTVEDKEAYYEAFSD